MSFGVSYRCNRFFFDRTVVKKGMDRATHRALSFAGGLTRKIARRSIRKRKKPSEPGKPPSSHTGDLREGITYHYDPVRKTVIVGPRKFNQRDIVAGKWTSGTIPQVLEEGGRIGIVEQQILAGGKWFRVDKRFRANDKPKRVRTVAIEPRPFMAPALDTARPLIASKWKDSIR